MIAIHVSCNIPTLQSLQKRGHTTLAWLTSPQIPNKVLMWAQSTAGSSLQSVATRLLNKRVTCYAYMNKCYIQYSQRGTFIWTPVTAIYLYKFAENDHRDRCFLPIFRVVTGVQLPTAVNTARRGVRTPRIPMAGHGGPWWLIAYFIQFTCTLCRRSLAGDHRGSSRSVIAKREGHDYQGQRVFGRGVRPRVDNSDHCGQRVYEGSALAVLYVHCLCIYIFFTLIHHLHYSTL